MRAIALILSGCAATGAARPAPSSRGEAEISFHGSSLLVRSRRLGTAEGLSDSEDHGDAAPAPEDRRASGGRAPLPPRRLERTAFPGPALIADEQGKCKPPAGETCACHFNPSFQCYYAPKAGDKCRCMSYDEGRCASKGGSFCKRPDSCVKHCKVCRNEKTCQECAAGYMVLGGLCTKAPSGYAKKVLKAHNVLRCVHGAPALKWSSAAAASARKWAKSLKTMVHSASYKEPPPAGPAGENLAIRHRDTVRATESWYSEVDCCSTRPDGSYKDGCQTGSCGTGHFTAMIWHGAAELGCARNEKTKIDVCRYKGTEGVAKSTPNIRGNYEEMVRMKVSSVEKCIAKLDGGGSASPPTTTVAPSPSKTTTTPRSRRRRPNGRRRPNSGRGRQGGGRRRPQRR